MSRHSDKITKMCKYHEKECLWTPKATTCIQRQKEMRHKFREKIVVPQSKTCIICEKHLPAKFFHADNTVLSGLKGACKQCVKTRDYARYTTWSGYIHKKVVTSWKSHGNNSANNKLSIEDAFKLLEIQQYKCKHCGEQLECTMGTQKKNNYKCASLDRIDVDIVGYGSGNAQWLCMSCNNGKNTMPDHIHKEKFLLKDDRIKWLESENKMLRKELNLLRKEKSMNAVHRLNGGGSKIVKYILVFHDFQA